MRMGWLNLLISSIIAFGGLQTLVILHETTIIKFGESWGYLETLVSFPHNTYRCSSLVLILLRFVNRARAQNYLHFLEYAV